VRQQWMTRRIPERLQGATFAAVVGVIQEAGETLVSGRELLRLALGVHCLLPAAAAQREWTEGCGLVAASLPAAARRLKDKSKSWHLTAGGLALGGVSPY